MSDLEQVASGSAEDRIGAITVRPLAAAPESPPAPTNGHVPPTAEEGRHPDESRGLDDVAAALVASLFPPAPTTPAPEPVITAPAPPPESVPPPPVPPPHAPLSHAPPSPTPPPYTPTAIPPAPQVPQPQPQPQPPQPQAQPQPQQHPQLQAQAQPPPRPSRRGSAPLRPALRTLLRQRRRMALSIVAVALGVGYLAGSLSLLQRVGNGLAAQVGADSERADLVIEGTIADDGPLQQVRKLVPDSLVDMVAGVPGVAAVEARLESRSTMILGPDGTPVVPLGLTERPMGANFPTDDAMNPYRLVGEGRPPRGAGEVVLDERTAREAGVSVGDDVEIINKAAPATYELVGIVRLAAGDLPDGSSLALFDTTTARDIFEMGTDDNAIAIRLEPGAGREEVAAAIERLLFADAEVTTGAEHAEHRQVALAKSFTLIRMLLIGFAGMAVVVGAFTVANSMALLFDHRRRGFALLRLLGASQPQLVGSAVTEAAIGGTIAGALGLVVGLAIGTAIEQILRTLDATLPVAGSMLTWWIPLVAVGVGAAVTVLTSLRPATDAARTPPLHAVTGADDARGEPSAATMAIRWTAIVAGLAVTAAACGRLVGGARPALVAAVVGATVGTLLLAIPRLLSRVVAAVTSLLLRDSPALRRTSALRSRGARTRAASTTAALLLAAMVVAGLTVISSSFVESAEGQFGDAVTADLVIDSGTFTNGGLSSELIGELRNRPEVAAVSGWGPATASVGAAWSRAGAVDIASFTEVLDLDLTVERPAVAFGPQDIVISEDLAEANGIELGAAVTVGFQRGTQLPATVRGIFRSQLNLVLGDILINRDQVAENLPLVVDVLAFVKLADDAPPGIRGAIESTSVRYGAAKVLAPSELVASRAELLRGFARVIQWMLGFSVVLALIGVANTLQLSVNERHRELGLLRAVGATRRQILRIVMAEATALSLVGTVIGVTAGIVIGRATVSALSPYGMNRFVAPVGTLVAIAGVAIVVGHLAAIVPAVRATRVPVLDAVSDSDDGGTPRATARVPRRGADGTGPAPDVRSEVEMALRCYHCGYEPGDGVACAVCGAPQAAPEPVYAAAMPPPYHPGPEVPVAAPAPAGPEEIVVVDAGHDEIVDVTPPPPPMPPPAPAPPPTYAVHANDAEATRPGASIFGERPTEDDADPASASPFGQHASHPLVSFTNGDADGHVDAELSGAELGAVAGVVADRHGLSAAVARLGSTSQVEAGVPFSIAGALLDPSERVRVAAYGSSLGMPTVVVLTDRRILVVSDRRYLPDVEVFTLGADLTIHGRHANGFASLTFGDRDRLVTVDRIPDVAVAVDLATAARNPEGL